jgi:hypothetical protein
VLRAFLERHLPEDAAERCSGTTHVALTRVLPYVWPVTVSEFTSRCAPPSAFGGVGGMVG